MASIVKLQYTMIHQVDPAKLFGLVAYHTPYPLMALAAGKPDADGVVTVDLTMMASASRDDIDAGTVCARVMTELRKVRGIGRDALTMRVREDAAVAHA